METRSRKVGSVDCIRERGVGDPTRSALPPRRQPTTKEEQGGTNSDNDDDPLADVEGTGSHSGSLPRRRSQGCL